MSMTYSKKGLQLTEGFEGCRLKAYQDSKGVWTIGFGHTGRLVVAGLTCTQAQAEEWLASDIAWAASEVSRVVKVPLTQAEFDALVDFVFNTGAGNFQHSSLLALLNHNDHVKAAAEFEKWDKCGGVELPGLLRRRKAEAKEFLAAA
jgi:lysozyme